MSEVPYPFVLVSSLLTFLLTFSANIHCPSCVSTIESVLETCPEPSGYSLTSAWKSIDKALDVVRSRSPSGSSSGRDSEEEHKPACSRISVSIVNGTVSFSHSPKFSLKPIIAELEDAGFEVVQVNATDLEATHIHSSSVGTSKGSRWLRFEDLFGATEKRKQAHQDNCEACREEREAHSKDKIGLESSGKHALRPPISEEKSGSRIVVNEMLVSIEGMTCT